MNKYKLLEELDEKYDEYLKLIENGDETYKPVIYFIYMLMINIERGLYDD